MRKATSRFLLIVLLLLAVVIGSAPYLTGMLVQTKFQDVVKVLSSIDSMPVVITVTDYHRGWIRSIAKTSVTFAPNNQKNYTIYLEHEICHGPLVQVNKGDYLNWRLARGLVHSQLMLTEEAKKILISEVGETKLINIKSIFGLDGAVKFNLEAKPFKLKEHEGTERIAFQGAKGEWQLSSDMQHLKGEMVLPGFDFDFNGMHFFAQKVTYQTDLFKSPSGLWPGTFTSNIQALKIGNNQAKVGLNAQAITTHGAMKIEENKVNFSGSANIQKIFLNDKEYGPVAYVNSLKNIDVKVVKSLFDLNQKMKMVGSTQSVYIQYLLALIPDLLKTRPEFTIDQLKIKTQQGEINGLLYFAVGGIEAFDINNMKQVINSISAKADLSLPKVIFREMLTSFYTKNAIAENEMAKQSQNQSASSASSQSQPSKVLTEEEIIQQVDTRVNESINRWLQENTLVEKDPNYILSLELNEGSFTINHQKVELKPTSPLQTPGLSQSSPSQPGSPSMPSPNSPKKSSTPSNPDTGAPLRPKQSLLPNNKPGSGKPEMPSTPSGPEIPPATPSPSNPLDPSGLPNPIR